MKGKEKSRYLIVACEYILSFLIILDCNSVYANLVDSPYNLQKIALLFSILLIGLICWYYKIDIKMLFLISIWPAIPLIIWALILTQVIQIEPGYAGSYIKYFVLFLPISVVIFKIYRLSGKIYQLFFRISDVVMVLSALSLVLWFLIAVMGVLQPNMIICTEWGGELQLDSFYGLYFQRSVQMEDLGFWGIKIYRNIGLYPESPMYSIILLVSYFTELFFRERPKKTRIVLFLITLISSFATLGLIIAIMGMALASYYKIKDVKNIKLITAFLGIGFIVTLFALIAYKKTYGQGSFNAHIDDIAACIKAWLTAPFFGTGFENNSVIYQYMADFRKNNPGYTTSAGAVLAQGGIALFLIYILPFIKLVFNWFDKEKSTEIFWGIGMFAIFCFTVFTYRFLLFWILAFGYASVDIFYKGGRNKFVVFHKDGKL